MKVIPLGTAGFIPTNGKETMSVLVLDGSTALLIDAGTGVKRLAEPALVNELQGINTLHVMFSHFHHDHTCGVTWLLRLWPGSLSFQLPSPPLIEHDGKQALISLTSPPYFALPLDQWPNCRQVSTITTSTFEIGGLKVQTMPQRHSGGSIGIRIGDFAYITDTEPQTSHQAFLHDCRLAFMDTMFDSDDHAQNRLSSNAPADHGNSIGNAEIAKRAGVHRLGLVHVNPLYTPDRTEALKNEAEQVFQGCFLPVEGKPIQPAG